MTKQYAGECLCGNTRYKISASNPMAMFFCHCSRCRKETGTVHGANIFFKNGELTFERGEENISFYNLSGTRHSRAFCKICGSPLPRREGAHVLVVPAGGLDEGYNLEPTAHVFVSDKARWEDKISTIPRFETLPK